MDIDIDFRRFKVVHIRCSGRAYIVRVTRNQVRKLGVNLEGRRRGGGYPRYLVYRVAEPLHLRLPAGVDTPNGVRQRFLTGVDLCGQRLLAHVHQRTANHQVLVELIFEV